MHKILLTFLVATLFAFTGSQTSAQTKVSPVKEALIRELLEVTGSTKGVAEVATMMSAFQQAEAQKMIGAMIDEDKTFTAAEKVELKQASVDSLARVTKRIDEFFTKEFDFAVILNEIALPIYDRNFTETELRELISFYRTPVGRKTVSLMPSLMMESMTGFSEKVMPKLQEFLRKAADEEFVILKRKADREKTDPSRPKTKS